MFNINHKIISKNFQNLAELILNTKKDHSKIPKCNATFDQDQAVDLLLMARDPTDQKSWINSIQKMLPKNPPAPPNQPVSIS